MVKGNLMQENARGLVNGGSYDAKTFPRCLRGWARINGEYSVNAPSQTIDLPEGQWQCLANGSDSFLWKKNLCQKATCTIQPMTAGIFGN